MSNEIHIMICSFEKTIWDHISVFGQSGLLNIFERAKHKQVSYYLVKTIFQKMVLRYNVTLQCISNDNFRFFFEDLDCPTIASIIDVT